MAPPSRYQTNRILVLVRELHQLVDRSCAEVMVALLSTETMSRLGYRGTGRIETAEQADAGIRILESWIRKKKHEHQ